MPKILNCLLPLKQAGLTFSLIKVCFAGVGVGGVARGAGRVTQGTGATLGSLLWAALWTTAALGSPRTSCMGLPEQRPVAGPRATPASWADLGSAALLLLKSQWSRKVTVSVISVTDLQPYLRPNLPVQHSIGTRWC